MLKLFDDKGICRSIISIGDYSLAREDAKDKGYTAVESDKHLNEVLVDGVLHEVSSPWTYDRNTEITTTGYKLVDGAYQYTYTETDITAEIEARDAEFLKCQINDKKALRNTLLAETDFYALGDVTMSDAMKTYRQALRDLPAQDGFPTDINWPTLGE